MRHQQQPDRVGFADVVVAQQTYAAAINSFTTALGAQWTAVTDLLNTVQVEDLTELERLVDQIGRGIGSAGNRPRADLAKPVK